MARTLAACVLARINHRNKDIDLNTLGLNTRYQLARLSRALPNRLDARINRVVQCRDEKAREQVEQRLQLEGLLSATVNPWHAGLHAWQITLTAM